MTFQVPFDCISVDPVKLGDFLNTISFAMHINNVHEYLLGDNLYPFFFKKGVPYLYQGGTLFIPEKIGRGIMPRRGKLDVQGILHHVIQTRSDLAGKLVEELGVPLAEIARQLGVSTSAISQLFRRRGKSQSTLSIPSLKTWIILLLPSGGFIQPIFDPLDQEFFVFIPYLFQFLLPDILKQYPLY